MTNQEPHDQESYRKVAKSTVVFGGSQVVQMLTVLLRAKLIAVLIGPIGMGINSLILSAVSVVQQLSSMGIFQSGVREMVRVAQDNDPVKLSRFRKNFLILTLISAFAGTLLFIAFSPFLSKFLFENRNYTYWLMGASLTVLFMSLQNGYGTIMQATHNLGLLARATVAGAVAGLAAAATLFYFLRVNGIVPAMVAGSLAFFLSFKFYEKRLVFLPAHRIAQRELTECGKPILKLGFVLMFSFMLMTLFTFMLNAFISNIGSVEDVGYYQAAFSICGQGMALVTTILAADYFPRLSAIESDRRTLKFTVNQQTELMLFIIAPVSVVLMTVAPLLVTVLLSAKFQIVATLIRVMLIALIFRTLWILLSYIILAKGDKRTYFIYDALIGNGGLFLLNVAGYYFYGLRGLAVSYLAGSIIMTLLLSLVVRIKYKYFFSRRLVWLSAMFFAIMIFAYFVTAQFQGLWRYTVLALLSCFTVIYSFVSLNKNIGIAEIIKNRFKI